VGTLVSEDRPTVPSRVSGRVKYIRVQAGTSVEPNTIILELSNPQLDLSWKEAQTTLSSAEARYKAAKARNLSEQLRLEAGIAATEAVVSDAKLRFEVNKKQYEDGLISELDMKLSKSNVERLEYQLQVEKRQYDVWLKQTKPAEMILEEASLKQAQAQYNLRKEEFRVIKSACRSSRCFGSDSDSHQIG